MSIGIYGTNFQRIHKKLLNGWTRKSVSAHFLVLYDQGMYRHSLADFSLIRQTFMPLLHHDEYKFLLAFYKRCYIRNNNHSCHFSGTKKNENLFLKQPSYHSMAPKRMKIRSYFRYNALRLFVLTKVEILSILLST